jgi:hypothetical protein
MRPVGWWVAKCGKIAVVGQARFRRQRSEKERGRQKAARRGRCEEVMRPRAWRTGVLVGCPCDPRPTIVAWKLRRAMLASPWETCL